MEVPDGVLVERAFALDTARHLSILGHYPGFLARPDRWMTWRFGAIPAGMRLIREHRPDVIWSTYPVATAHIIGDALQNRSGLPWIADFRDPMAQEGYPEDPRTWRSFKRIEEHALAHARYSIFVTPGAARKYRDRYPSMSERIAVIENGFDEETFVGLVADPPAREPLNPGMLTLLHSGVVYPSERDPRQLFAALRQMVDQGVVRRGELRLRFRAAAHDALLQALARENAIEDLIELLPPIPYREALHEMVRADALLVLQASNCNEQIPAKVYEYLRAGRPIVALTDPHGDTAGVLRAAGIDTIARLDSVGEIVALLGPFLIDVRQNQAPRPNPACAARASRRDRADSLAAFLEKAAGVGPVA